MSDIEIDLTDLLDVIGEGLAADHRYCSRRYWTWENEVARPALEKLGYEDIKFFDGERDSFGPLTRVVHCRKDGNTVKLIYG